MFGWTSRPRLRLSTLPMARSPRGCRLEARAASQELELALRKAREVVRIEPYRESAYRRLMRMLDRKGDRAEAVRVYLEFGRLLQQDLGVTPSAETEALYREIAG